MTEHLSYAQMTAQTLIPKTKPQRDPTWHEDVHHRSVARTRKSGKARHFRRRWSRMPKWLKLQRADAAR